ncbi:MAG: elongation factor P maturation arginine rhamnosyltransferase EarP [Casimicrobiaceae bacterium]
MIKPQRWDIFCAVVDNYGDAGVAWRLARQLVAEYRRDVRLFVDALPVLSRMAPEVDPAQQEQLAQGVRIARWPGASGPIPPADIADVVIEAFGCGLPPSYVDAMSAQPVPPLWINLEYLSAERWVDGCHGLVSRHPRLPLQRRFYFPGFTAQSGGLLREPDLLARRDAFRADAGERAALWRSLGVTPPTPDARAVSLFSYANRRLPPLLDAWADGDAPVCCIVPEGTSAGDIDRWTGGAVPHPGQTLARGRLSLVGVPFVAQDIYDRLLWACDLNLVRGEDSFVRALWAARPLTWQPYPQDEDAERAKLDAFLEKYARGMPEATAATFRAWQHAWADPRGSDDAAGVLWDRFARELPALEAHARRWIAELATQRDLAASLVWTVEKRV